MIFVGVDSETALIQSGLLTPRQICLSHARRVGSEISKGLMLRRTAIPWLREQLLDSEVHLVVHNLPFDLAVACNEAPDLLPLVFDAFRAGRLHCTIVRQKLLDIAFGMRKFRRFSRDEKQIVTRSSYHLADLVLMYFNEHLEKQDTWRLSYALLEDIPVERWPQDARDYAIGDAVEHLRVFEAQEQVITDVFDGNLPNQLEQQQAAWVLHLMSTWGVRADAKAVDYFAAHCEEEIQKMRVSLLYCEYCSRPRKEHVDGSCTFKNTGILKEDGSRVMAEIRRRVVEACKRQSTKVPMTDPSSRFPEGQVQTDKEALENTDDPALHVLATQMTFVKHLSQWGPVCRAAVERPVCARYEVLVETGRTACSGSEGQEGTNFQNPPRKGDVRPCFVPEKGWLYCSTDADTIELRAQAQNCIEMLGWSKMAEALWDQYLNGGPDLHLRLAANIMGISLNDAFVRKNEGDKEVNDGRQFAKIPGFGLWGGLGAETLVAYAAAQLDKETHRKWFGVEREEQIARAKWLRNVWFETWPEAVEYFRIVGDMIDRELREGAIQQLMSGRIRGGVRFTAAANGYFQGRVADAEKDVLVQLGDESYTGRCTTKHTHGGSNLCTVRGRSVLFGSRTVLFLHDEPIMAHPEDGNESDRAERQRQIVIERLSHWMKDVPITSSAILTRRWHKGAEALKVNGKLVPVKPLKVTSPDGKTQIKWIQDFGEEGNDVVHTLSSTGGSACHA